MSWRRDGWVAIWLPRAPCRRWARPSLWRSCSRSAICCASCTGWSTCSAAIRLPPADCQALAEGGQHAVAPFAARHQRHGPAHAVAPGPAGHRARFVLGGEAELEQLRRAFLAVVAVVECEGGDRQLLAASELLDQRLLQWTDDQFDAIGLGLAVEVI